MLPRKCMHLHPHPYQNPIEPSSSPFTFKMHFCSQLLGISDTPLGSTTRAMLEVVLQAASGRAMHVLCGFLKGKPHCGGKLTDVTRGEESPIMHRTYSQQRYFEDEEELSQTGLENWFYGKTILETGDPSRNVIEMIFRATTTDIARCSIKQVAKLTNSKETIERFENSREDVKNRAYDPRNMVDGNEQLLFYGTKLTCCKKFGGSKLCRDSNCSICTIIKSGFYSIKKKTGIWLSTSCKDLIISNTNAEMMNVKMAIVVCRVITGRVIDVDDRDLESDYDSIRGVKSNYLFVRNPCAVLPCFVIILNCT